MHCVRSIALGLTVSLVMGCEKPSQEVQEKLDKAGQKIGEAVDATAEAFDVQRKELTEQVKEQLAKFDEKIQDLKRQAAEAAEDARKKIEAEIGTLEDNKKALNSQLEAIQSATQDTWDDVKSKTETLSERVRATIHDWTKPAVKSDEADES